jgi:hypothetical protein
MVDDDDDDDDAHPSSGDDINVPCGKKLVF